MAVQPKSKIKSEGEYDETRNTEYTESSSFFMGFQRDTSVTIHLNLPTIRSVGKGFRGTCYPLAADGN